MAAKEVAERRLRPVYDAIDNGQYKKAIQLADKVVKKQNDMACAKALKALALHRMGRTGESTAVAHELKAHLSADDATLQAMTMYYKETDRPDQVCEIYEAAVKLQPKNDELLSHLFMSYVRVSDYGKQQRVALALYKVVPNNPYYFWSVMSIFMQGHSNPPMERTVFLPLAERMVVRFVEEKKIDAEAEVKMYLMILERLGKHDEVAKVLESPLGGRIAGADEHGRLLVDSLVKGGQHSRAVDLLEGLLLKSPDQWSYIVDYIRLKILLAKDDQQHYVSARDFLTSLATIQAPISTERSTSPEGPACTEKPASTEVAPSTEGNTSPSTDVPASTERPTSAKGHVARAPYLSKIELVKQLRNMPESEGKELPITSKPVDDLLVYFDKFGSKPCFFEDIYSFLHVLLEEEKAALLKGMAATVDRQPIDFHCLPADKKENVKRLQLRLSWLQTKHWCGAHASLSYPDKMAAAEMVYEDYLKGLSLGAGDDHSTEWHPADPYALLYAHMALEACQESGSHAHLGKPLVRLELAHKTSPANAQISLLLLKLYSHLEAFEPCTRLYDHLDIKKIQVDTVGYLLNRCMMTSGIKSLCETFCGFAITFYSNAAKEVREYIIQAYKNGSFPVVLEMTDLQHRLGNSFQHHSILRRKQILSLTHSVPNYLALQESLQNIFAVNIAVTSDGLVDNRDLGVLDFYGPPSCMLPADEAKNTFTFECACFEMLSAVMEAVKMAAAAGWDDRAFRLALARLETAAERARKFCSARRTDFTLVPIQSPPLCEVTVSIQFSFDKALLALFKVVLALKSNNDEGAEEEVKACLETALQSLSSAPNMAAYGLAPKDYAALQTALDSLEGKSPKSPLDVLMCKPVRVEVLAVFCQVVSIVILLAECSVQIVCGCHNNHQVKRKKKGKSNQPSFLKCQAHVGRFIEKLAVLVDSHSAAIQQLPTPSADKLKDKLGPDNKDLRTAIDVYNSLASSCNSSLEDCKEVLSTRSEQLDYISKLLKN